MTIKENLNGITLELNVEGRLDTTTAPQLESRLKECPNECKSLILDLKDVSYISSAGLRVVLLAHKLMTGTGGKMSVRNPSEFCRQVFQATGMEGVLSII
ncbi:MAG: STAS domain-containing protein [Spirochaetaceae bacterium]|nr:STAS domain-containing protein [Spirochaetaceae bacterium]